MTSDQVPIVYFYYGALWGKSLGRQRMLTEELAKRHPLIFVEIMDASPSQLGRRALTTEQVSETTWIVRGFMDTWRSKYGSRCRPVSAMIDGIRFEACLKQICPGPYIFWLSSCMPEIVTCLKRARVVYDCIDPPFGPNQKQRSASLNKELKLAKRADLCFATAQTLADGLAPSRTPVHLLPNALDPSQLPSDQTTAPETVQKDERPIVGYLGTIDIRFAAHAVADAAKSCPDHHFVLAGRINLNQEASMKALRNMNNVTLTGAVSFEEGKRLLNVFDIGLIPFSPGPYGDGINPVKMWMYLGLGLPIVGLTTAELRRYPDWVSVADDGAELAKLIQQADTSPMMADRRRSFANQNTWAQRAETGLDILRKAGLLDPQPSGSKPARAAQLCTDQNR